jgi:heat shock protein 1/8
MIGNSRAIGIDLGTTYSCVAVWRNGRVEIIPNDQGNRTTPSYVAFTDTERLIGDAAKNQVALNPENTIFDSKRLIGRKFSDSVVQEDMKHWPFKVVSKPGDKPYIRANFKGQEHDFAPEEISSMVLLKMKETAEAFLGHPVTDAVITVPAYFNDSQRLATKDAGTLAGLNVIRTINEPTAAALAYGLDKTKDGEQNILIFDLGGGTFDVTLLTLDEGVFEVRATGGNTHLGGEDFDNRLVNHLLRDFKAKHKVDPSSNAKAIRRLRTACEKAKRTLSASPMASIEIDAFFQGIDFYTQITRARFEELCSDLFKQCLEPVERVIREAKMDKSKINEVILVGGSTRVPKVQQLLSEFFGGKELNRSINPDEAVAYGAAVQAAILKGEKDEKLDPVILVDVASLSLGVETAGGAMTTIIPCQTNIPVAKSEIFTTHADYQRAVTIKVYEGERPLTRDNHLLGTFELTDIPPAPRGVPQIKVTFDVDTSGVVTVTAEDVATRNTKKITVNNDRDRLTPAEIEAMLAKAAAMKEEDDKMRKKIEAKNKLESFVYGVKSSLNEEQVKAKLSEAEHKRVLDAIEECLQWIEARTDATEQELEEKKKQVEAVVNPVFAKLYQQQQGQQGAPTQSAESHGPTVEEVDD